MNWIDGSPKEDLVKIQKTVENLIKKSENLGSSLANEVKENG